MISLPGQPLEVLLDTVKDVEPMASPRYLHGELNQDLTNSNIRHALKVQSDVIEDLIGKIAYIAERLKT